MNLAWRIFDINNDDQDEIFKSGITDLAFAGVVVVVSTFTNTYFSISLLGWRSMGWGTFGLFLAVGITSPVCFVTYIEATHGYIHKELYGAVFLIVLLLVISNINFSIVTTHSFLSDGFKQARYEIKYVPGVTTWEEIR